jgi:hypothetical protein
MGWFRSTPEERAAKERVKAEAAKYHRSAGHLRCVLAVGVTV